MPQRASSIARPASPAITCAVATALLAAGMLTTSPARAAKKEAKSEQPATLRNFVESETDRLEQEMAALIQQKAAVAAASSGWLDLRIDSRVISRWTCQQLFSTGPMSDAQAVAWLRYQDALSLSATLDSANLAAAPSAAQAAALVKIHRSTFDMKDADSIAAIDAYLTALRDPLLVALNAKKSDDLRPPLLEAKFTAKKAAATSEAPLSLEAMSTRVTQLSISVSLRQQLLAAIGGAKAATPEDAPNVTAMLRDAIGMATMLQTNFAVDPEARARLEKELGQAVVLYSDPRVREAGQRKLNGLKQYRILASRVAAMKLSPELLKAFAPVITAARDQPEEADKMLSAVEEFSRVDAHMATVRSSVATDAASRAAEQQLKNFAAQRNVVLSAAPDEVAGEVAKLKQTADLYDLLKSLPQTQTQLLTLHPRPTGALEKRLMQAVVHSAADGDPQQEASIATLTAVGAFVSNWQAAQEAMLKPVDDAEMKKFTGKTWSDATAAVRSTAAELASATASGADLDVAKIQSLSRIPAVLRGVRRGAAVSAALGDAKALARWADCDLDEKKIAAILQGYQAESSPVASAVIEGGGDDKSLTDLENRYRGLLNTLDLIAAAIPACEKMPTDLGWLLCRLTTPSDHTPREAPVRKLCWTTSLLALMQAEPDGGGDIATQIHDRMLQDLNRMLPGSPAESTAVSSVTP